MSLVDRADGVHAVIAVAAAVCPRCAEGKGCGAGIFQAGSAERQLEVKVRDGLDLAVNDVVELSLAPDNVLRAALIVYGLPMAGAIAGAACAWALGLGDVAAAIFALLGLVLGLATGRWRLRRADCMQEFTPSVEGLR